MWETCPEFLRRSARSRLEPTTSRSRVRRSTATPRRHLCKRRYVIMLPALITSWIKRKLISQLTIKLFRLIYLCCLISSSFKLFVSIPTRIKIKAEENRQQEDSLQRFRRKYQLSGWELLQRTSWPIFFIKVGNEWSEGSFGCSLCMKRPDALYLWTKASFATQRSLCSVVRSLFNGRGSLFPSVLQAERD